MPHLKMPTRRAVTTGLAATMAGLAAPRPAPAAGDEHASPEAWRDLPAAPARTRLRPEPAAETDIWALDGQASGPVLRIRHGDEARFRLINGTERPLSLHWHGVRNTNAMDGVGGLTQNPVEPGRNFDYRFTPPDAGTFLIRPLVVGGSGEPAGRGVSGLLVVEEREPPAVDQDIALVVDDWLVDESGALAPFGHPLVAATAGRLGNVLTVNAKPVPRPVEVAPGSRVRLRLANACNARAFRLRFDDLKVYVAAVDGQPTDTFEPLRASLPFAPGTRYDLVFDAPKEIGSRGAVTALIGGGVPLVTIATAGDPLDTKPPIAALPANKRLPPEIRLQGATRKDIVIAGGARPGPGGEPVYGGDPKAIWTMNGTPGSVGTPLVSVKRGSPVVFGIRNQTSFVQPLHLHGHVFRLLHPADDGWDPYWLDTLQVPEGRTVHIAFVADNPGRWALSSTVLERFDTGLWAWFEVT